MVSGALLRVWSSFYLSTSLTYILENEFLFYWELNDKVHGCPWRLYNLYYGCTLTIFAFSPVNHNNRYSGDIYLHSYFH